MRPILKRSSASSSPSYTPPHPPSHPSSSPSHPPSNAHPHTSSSSHPHTHHAVHFPPQPSLTRTFSAHSSSIYDRTPIAVTPNSCALPERGCPGRTYTLDESTSLPTSNGNGATRARRGHPSNGRDLHPRALGLGFHHNPHTEKQNINVTTNDTARSGFPALPALIPDLSSASESDESDGFVSPPQYQYQDQEAASAYYTSGSVTYRRVSLSPGVGGGEQYPPPLSFLPHPPSPPSHSHSHGRTRVLDEDNVQVQRRRRDRRRSRSRSRSRSRDRVRTIATVAMQDEEDEYYDPLPLPSSPSPSPSLYPSPSPSLYPYSSPYPYSSSATSPSIPKSSSLRKPRKSALCRTLPSIGLDVIMDDPVDGGCLGGF